MCEAITDEAHGVSLSARILKENCVIFVAREGIGGKVFFMFVS